MHLEKCFWFLRFKKRRLKTLANKRIEQMDILETDMSLWCAVCHPFLFFQPSAGKILWSFRQNRTIDKPKDQKLYVVRHQQSSRKFISTIHELQLSVISILKTRILQEKLFSKNIVIPEIFKL